MKHQYDEPTMQAAIDAALPHTLAHAGNFRATSLDMTPLNGAWDVESHVRLHLLKTALEMLPESPPPLVDGKTPGQVNHDAVTNGDYDTYKKWSELSERGKRDVERGASAVLAAFGKTQLSTLRPIAEAGEVSCSNCNALAAENALLRDALSKAERLIFGSHGAVFLPAQMQAYNLAVSKIQPQIK